jgi:hypothetical protein
MITIVVGAVAMLDALGVSHLSTDQCVTFLTEVNDVLEECDAMMVKVTASIDLLFPKQDEAIEQWKTTVTPLRATIGDTIELFFVNTDKADALCAAGTYCSFFMNRILEKGYLFRGAISFGDIVTDKVNQFIGPAVVTAARSYELLQLHSLTVVPDCDLAALNDGARPEIRKLLLKYFYRHRTSGSSEEVPTEAWHVAWPVLFQEVPSVGTFNKHRYVPTLIHRILQDRPAPERDLPKYANTIEFAKDYIRDYDNGLLRGTVAYRG